MESDGFDEEGMDEEGFSGLGMGSSCCISLLDVQRALAIYFLGSRRVICL